MSLLVVGSVALDGIETPTDARADVLGGSAVHFSYAASFFSPVRLVGVVGDDWPSEHTELLQGRKVDTAGLQVIEGGKTFRWTGKYHPNMNDRDTLDVQLNVFGEFQPQLPETYRDSKWVFLANGAPMTQMSVLEQTPESQLVMADTMDLWINTAKDDLLQLLKRVDGLLLNDSEALLLTGEENIVRAGRKVCEMGPKFAVVKKGEHGALLFFEDQVAAFPAYPTETVIDPTGAGDSFAGGLFGYLAECDQEPTVDQLKRAIAYGTLVASFQVEDFGLDRLKQIDRSEIDARLEQFSRMLSL